LYVHAESFSLTLRLERPQHPRFPRQFVSMRAGIIGGRMLREFHPIGSPSLLDDAIGEGIGAGEGLFTSLMYTFR
jgi:hypothetical protein